MWLTLISIAALACAFGAEWFFEIAPCALCWVQRGLFFSLTVTNLLKWTRITRIIVLIGFFVSVYHVGVEKHWWKSPMCESSTINTSLNHKTEEEKHALLLKEMEQESLMPSCDQVLWRIFGVSATIYTMLLYVFILGGLWYEYRFYATRRSRR